MKLNPDTKLPPFSVLPHLFDRFDALPRKLAYRAKTVPEWRRWRKTLRAKLKAITGYDTMQRCPLRPRITEEVQFDGYRRQRVEIQTEPKVIMPLYVLIPDGASGRLPAILCPHGHISGGKLSPAGVRDHSKEVAEQIEVYNYDYAVQFCLNGFITFCPDARGFGERREQSAMAQGILYSSCEHLNHMAYPLGQTVTGMWTWDMHRLLDYVQSRRDCDPDRIGCAGLSGGGLQTLWATALDDEDRIKCAVISGYLYGYKQSLLELYSNCSCNYVPGLYEHVDMADIAALIAPRPLLIETGDQDPLNGVNVENVTSQVRIIRRAYARLGAKDRIVHDLFEGGHKWHGTETIGWMKRWMK